MSVSSHLRSPRSAVRAWFASRLPNTVKVATAANRALTRPANHELAATEPLAVVSTPRGRNPSRAPLAGSGNPSLVGTAVDVLLNQTLDPGYGGHGLRGSPTVGGADLVWNCERALTPLLAAGDVRAAAPHVLLLAAFHQAHRSIDVGLALRQALEQHEPKVVEDCRGVLWQVADEDDLVALGTAALEDLAFARDADQLVVNPVFGLSRRLGGADGDLITDGTLWDYKTTATSRVVGRSEVWQLVAYLLADDTDSYSLHSVGVIALRWRTRLAWPAIQLLSDLSGDPPADMDLARWRAEFVEILPAARPRPRLRHPGPDAAAAGDDAGEL